MSLSNDRVLVAMDVFEAHGETEACVGHDIADLHRYKEQCLLDFHVVLQPVPGPADAGRDDEVYHGQTNEDVVEQLVGVEDCVCGFVGGLDRERLSRWIHAMKCQ